MKSIYVFLAVSTLAQLTLACGSSSEQTGSPSPAQTNQGVYTMVVNSNAELPACSPLNPKQLVYVTSESTFKSCESGNWTNINIQGKDGSTGLSITSNQLLNPHSNNICTMFSSIEVCYFNGGQLVKYSDGTVHVTGTYSYSLLIASGSNGGYAEYDRLSNSITLLIPPTAAGGFQRLDWGVSRGSTANRSLFLVYDRTTDAVSLIFDTNGSGSANSGDETVHTAVKTNW